MPVDRSRYPADWEQISRRIRFGRAGGRCEWCGAEHGRPHPVTGSRVVLTCAHLGTPHADGTPGDKHDKMDVRDENLAALCQRCHLRYHLRYDIDEHIANRRLNARLRQIAAGQLSLPLP